MRGLLTFIGGLAVGILAVTGVFAMGEESKPRSIEHHEDGMEAIEDETEDDADDEGKLIVRSS